MVSLISDDSVASIDFVPRSAMTSGKELELPNKIPTPATQYAPKGYVIDDSARGTIFWEAQSTVEEGGPRDPREDEVKEDEAASVVLPHVQAETEQVAGETQSFGKPFKIEWLSTERLPFYRTRGLRNTWNSNREVKIARDGTELEPSVGRRLIAMFHRPQVAGSSNVPAQGQQAMHALHQAQSVLGYDPSLQAQQRFYPRQ